MKMQLSAESPSGRVALYAVLLSAALMISYAEAMLPTVMPGMKLGLANVTVMAAMCFSPSGAVCVSIGRVFICAVLFGSSVSFVMSAAGAVCSLLILLVVRRIRLRMFSWIGVSVMSAAAHNGGQLVAAFFLVGDTAVFSYAPLLLISSVVCGVLSGFVMNAVAAVIEKRQAA